MKFLTEDDLRLKYNDFPFETFTIEKNTRLTPGAKTFLMDRQIIIIDDNNPFENIKRGISKTKNLENQSQIKNFNTPIDNYSTCLLRCEFLKAATDLAAVDLTLAQELAALENYLETSKAGEEQSPPVFKITKSSDKVTSDYLVRNLSTVSLFIQLDKGKILARLYPLYFQIIASIKMNPSNENNGFEMVCQRLGQLISYYLNLSEENSDETK